MRSKFFIFGVFLLVLITGLGLSSPVHATIKVLGIDTTRDAPYAYIFSLPYLTGITFTEVTNAGFATVNLYDYDVLFVSETFLDALTNPAQGTLNALNARADDIAKWIRKGGGVVALSEPSGTGRFGWLPNAPTVGNYINWEIINIVDPTHPVMNGLTDASLSNWGTSSHGNFTSYVGWEVLATDGGTRPITLAEIYGRGKIVLTDQDADYHFYFNSANMLIQNAIDWAAEPVKNPVPEPGTMLLLGSGLIGLAGYGRKKFFKK